jgi:putative membrane protein insertion efficiency factor
VGFQLPRKTFLTWEWSLMTHAGRHLWITLHRAPRSAARWLIKGYRYTLSPLVGFRCRHLPTCSEYADEAIDRHGLWAGGWIALGRILRCHPFGTSGLDFVPEALPTRARWFLPWRYAKWSWIARDEGHLCP